MTKRYYKVLGIQVALELEIYNPRGKTDEEKCADLSQIIHQLMCYLRLNALANLKIPDGDFYKALRTYNLGVL